MSGPNINGFQATVNNALPVAVAGDVRGNSLKIPLASPTGGVISPVGGLTTGAFACVDSAGVVTQGYVAAAQIGFLARSQGNGVNTGFLSPASVEVNAGFITTLYTRVDAWALCPEGCVAGATVYMNNTTGLPTMSSSGATATNWKSATNAAAGELMGISTY